jgi:hypothetical protein
MKLTQTALVGPSLGDEVNVLHACRLCHLVVDSRDTLHRSSLRDVDNDVSDLPVEVCRIDKVFAIHSIHRCAADVLVSREYTKTDETSGCDEGGAIVGLRERL